MLKKKPNWSYRDNDKRFSKIRVTFNVEDIHIVYAIAELLSNEEKITQQSVYDQLKNLFHSGGMNAFNYYEERFIDFEEVEESAKAKAKELFPEYFKK